MNRITLLALATLFVSGSAIDPVTGPAGIYSVTTTGPTRVTSGEGWVRIEWDVEPTVPAPPPPGPVAPPPVVTPEKPVVVPPVVTTPASTPPPVFTGKVFLQAVYDIAKAGNYPPEQQAILFPSSKGGSATIESAMTALGISWQPRDINDQILVGKATDAANWKTEALKQGLPCVIAIGQDGQRVSFWIGPLSSDEAAALELGKKLVGK